MTEWWVSQSKHWCDICKVWCGGHLSQIKKHTDGIGHIEKEKMVLQLATAKEKEKRAQDRGVKAQLEEIERKALAAMSPTVSMPSLPVGSVAPPSAPASAEQLAGAKREREAQKSAIVQTIEAAKRQRLEQPATTGSACPWTKHQDPNSKAIYYYNASTKQSSWEQPPDFFEAPAVPETATTYFYDPKTRKTRAATPAELAPAAPAAAAADESRSLPSGWVSAVSPTGHPYYYNASTGVSTYERPVSTEPPSPAPQGASETSVVAASTAPSWRETSVKEADPCPSLDDVQALTPLSIASTAPMAPMAVAIGTARSIGHGASVPLASASAPAPPPAPVGVVPIAQAPVSGNVYDSYRPQSSWVVVTDPNSGHVYYYNQNTQESSWTKPAELGVDLSKPPPPPKERPANRPAPVVATQRQTMVGGWEEVTPEQSMWGRPDEVEGAVEMDRIEEERTECDTLIDLKEETRRRGAWMEEDCEVHEKQIFEKLSNKTPLVSNSSVSFGKRKVADGIRKDKGDD